MHRIQFRISKNKSFELEQVICILLFVTPFLNLWSFFGYYAKLYIVAFTLGILLLIKMGSRLSWNKMPTINKLFLFYMTIHMLFINFPESATYYILIITGCWIGQLKFSKRTISFMQSVMIGVGVFYSITMIWQWADEPSFNAVLRLFVLEGNYQQALESVVYIGDYTGFACESNRACICIAPAASILFSRLFFKTDSHYRRSLVLFCITYFSIILSGRRAFIIFFPVVLVGASLYFLFRKRSKSAKLLAILLVFALFIVFYFFLYDKVIFLLTRGDGTTIALSNREVYWELALQLFRENPLFGSGMRSYDYHYNLMSGRDIVFAGAHNSYLEMLAEIGIVGTILFSTVILYMIIKTASSTVYCMRYNNKEYGQILMSALLVQCMLVFAGLSEAVFFAPFSLIMYFVFNNISLNTITLLTKNKSEKLASYKLILNRE